MYWYQISIWVLNIALLLFITIVTIWSDKLRISMKYISTVLQLTFFYTKKWCLYFYLICVAIFDLSIFVSSSSAVNSTIFAFFFFFVIDGYYLYTINHASFYNLMHNVVIWFTLWFVTCVTLWGILIVIKKKWSHFI